MPAEMHSDRSVTQRYFLDNLRTFFILLVIRIKLNLSRLSFAAGVWLVFGLGLAQGLILYAVGWEGWTKIGIIDFQNERILLYLMMFLLGMLGYRRRIFDQPMKNRLWLHLTNGTSWIPI